MPLVRASCKSGGSPGTPAPKSKRMSIVFPNSLAKYSSSHSWGNGGSINVICSPPPTHPTILCLVFWWLMESGRTVHSEEAGLCSTFVRTVGVILHASAPSALDLREMTREYWDLLLSMRNSSSDPAVLESVLFGLLVILEITEARTAAEYFPKYVVETQAWTAGTSQPDLPSGCADLRFVSGG